MPNQTPRTSHTPGPLTIKGPSTGKGHSDDGGDYALVDTEGRIIAETFSKIAPGVHAPAYKNAVLFKAAPALLEALKVIAAHPGGDSDESVDEWSEAAAFTECKKIATDAIRLAEGEEQT